MMYLARNTGGRPFVNSNDLTLPILKVAEDATVTYTLGFYPDSSVLDSRRHTLKVEVDRKNVDLQYRPDYLATPESAEIRIPEKAEIAQAVWSPTNATGLALRVKADKVDQPQPGMVRLTLSIDREGIDFQRGEEGWTGTLAVVYDQRSPTGVDLGRISETLNLRNDEEHFRNLAAAGIQYERLVHPSFGASQIRVVVYDRGSGRVGSVTVTL